MTYEREPGAASRPVPRAYRRREPEKRRVLDVDGLKCPRCSTPMVVLAFLSDPAVVRRILEHLHLPPVPPGVAPARCPFDEPDFFTDSFSHDDPPDHDRSDPSSTCPQNPQNRRLARAPP